MENAAEGQCWAREASECAGAVVGAGLLCAKHEQEALPLARAISDLSHVMREIERLREVRKGLPKAWAPIRFTVDGAGIERGVLKLVFEHARAQGPSLAGWQPPAWLPEVVFAQKKLADGCGAALVARVGDALFDSSRVDLTLGKSARTGRYESAVLELREGWKLLCTWDTPVAELGDLTFGETKYAAGEDTLFHPRRISFRSREIDLGVSLDFDWTGRWSDSKYPAVAKLRPKPARP